MWTVMLLQGHSDPVLYIEMHFHIALNKRTIFFHGKSPSDAFEYTKEVERNEKRPTTYILLRIEFSPGKAVLF